MANSVKSAERQARLAAALRENLKRRKRPVRQAAGEENPAAETRPDSGSRGKNGKPAGQD